MASHPHGYWKCQKENCKAPYGKVREIWWHSWNEHKQFLCAHCGKEFQTFEDYDNHLSQHNDSDEAIERRQSSIGTSDPTEQPSTSNPTENVPAADRSRSIPISHEMEESFSDGFTVEDVQKLDEPYNCGYSPYSDFSAPPSSPKSSAIDKSKRIICIFPSCNWKNIESELDMHIRNVHLPKNETDRAYVCMLCERKLKVYEDIWWHYLKEHKRYACYDCGDLFFTIHTYYEHRLAHKNNKIVGKDQHAVEPKHIGRLFLCPYAFCAMSGNTKAVKVHIRDLHVRRKQKKCCKCNIGNCDNLWFHYWNIHKVLVCEFCQLYFETYMSYTEHRETYHRSEMQVPSRRRDASTCDVNVGASTSDVNVEISTSEVNVEASTSDVNVEASTSEVNVEASTSDVNVEASTSDVNVGASTSENPPRKLQKPF